MGHMARLTLLFLLLALASSCAKRTLVTLAPDPDGRAGGISVSNEGGSVAIDVPYQASTIAGAGKPPTAPVPLGKETVDKMFAEALSIQPERPLHFQLYFLEETTLASDSEKRLPDIVAAIRERHSSYISVIGHSDTLGTEDWNMQVSKKRAMAVKDLLVKQGVASGTIVTTYHGEQNPLIPTANDVWEPRNRRTEVVVR